MLARTENAMRGAGLLAVDGSPLQAEEPRVWIALTAWSNREQESADWLRRASLCAYWANFIRQVPCGRGGAGGRGGRRARLSSVIPGIIFAAARPGTTIDPWPIVHRTPCITGYLRDGAGRAASVTNDDIEIIRRIEGGLNLPPPAKAALRFKVGEKVQFVDDLFGRWPPGKVKQVAKDGRISVDVPMLGRVVAIWVYPHQIEAM
jgi:transcription antitermination factor NusG